MDAAKMTKSLESALQRRISSRANALFLKLCVGEVSEKVWIAGNSLNAGECHDIDVFFPKKGYTPGSLVEKEILLDDLEDDIEAYNDEFAETMGECKVLHTSQNAITVEYKGTTYQFCKYQKASLEELVESFDYAHIQVGCVVDFCGGIDKSVPTISEVHWTDAYVESLLTHKTWYVGSDYPLGSIFRAEKYKRYGILHGAEYKKAVVNALADLIYRGYKDYQDFKDSIGAIDLLLFDKSTADCLFQYFKACCSRGLVESYDPACDKMMGQSQFEAMMDGKSTDPNVNQEATLEEMLQAEPSASEEDSEDATP